MEQKTIDRIFRAVDDQFPIQHLKNWDEAMSFAEQTFKWILEHLRDRSELEKIFRDAPEPTAQELEDILYNIEHGVGILRRLFLSFVTKEMPHDRGGRPRKQGTPEERARRVRLVISLIEKGFGATAALKKVARKENLSLSSMQRIWRRRKDNSGNEDSKIDE